MAFPYYPRLRKELPNWGRLIDRLATPAFTSGDVNKVIGISRKVLSDWERREIFFRFYRGRGVRQLPGDHAGWRLFSIYDLWTLGIFKNLRDWGTWLEKLRPREKPAARGLDHPWLIGYSVPEVLYAATFYWVSRIPFYLFIGEKFIGSAPAERAGESRGQPQWTLTLYDGPEKKEFHAIRLLPVMDHIASALSRPDFKILLTPIDLLEANPQAVLPGEWQKPVQFLLDSEPLKLEALPEES